MTAVDPALGPAAPDRRLLDLQSLDLTIDRLRVRKTELESAEGLRQAMGNIQDLERRLGELKLSLDEVTVEQRRLENDIDALGQKAEAEQKRLYDGTVANVKELQSIESEVAGLRNRISAKEDRLLEVMERREELERATGPLEAELAEARGALAELDASAGKELDDIEQSLGEKEADRGRLAPAIDSEVLDLYEDLRRQKKGVGAVELVDGVCQGCHQKMSPVYLERLKRSDGVRRCEYCRRIVVT